MWRWMLGCAVSGLLLVAAPAIGLALPSRTSRRPAFAGQKAERVDRLHRLKDKEADARGGLRPVCLDYSGRRRGQAVGPLIAALGDKDGTVRAAAAYALGDVRAQPVTVVGPLIRLLADPDMDTRIAAAVSLGKFGPDARSAVEPLRNLLGVGDRQAQRIAADALGGVGPEARAAVPDLTPMVWHRDEAIRSAADRALARIGKDGVPALVAALHGDRVEVRRDAAEALAAINSDAKAAAAAALLNCLHDKDRLVRYEAAQSLARVFPKHKQTVDALVGLLDDPDGDVRTAAAALLGETGEAGTSSVPPLARVLLGDATESVRVAAARTWGTIGAVPKINTKTAVEAANRCSEGPIPARSLLRN